MKECTENSRSLALDSIRIVAVLAVIMIHTAMGFVKFDISSSSYMWGNIFDSLARIGVPLFVMVSGALMLDEKKEISVEKVFSKYILNIALLFVSWAFIYMIPTTAKAIIENKTITFNFIIKQLVSGGYHMWYLIMIIGLYLLIPVLKLFVKKENSEKIGYIILVSVIFMFFPALLTCLSDLNSVFASLSDQLMRFEYGFMGVFPTYFVTGWYVKHIGVKYKKTIYLLALISVLINIMLVQVTGNYSDAYSNGNILVYLYSLGIFTFINDVCKDQASTNIVEKLSNMTFGVYIIHIIVLEVIDIFFDNTYITPLSILIRFSLITLISFIGSYIISKIPGIRKLVRF